jgi:mannose-6-phosphate isomerase-like protein (cupin superfamily)
MLVCPAVDRKILEIMIRNSRFGCAALVIVGLLVAGSMADAEDLAAAYHLSSARGTIRKVDLSPFKGDVSGEILAGPANGLESAWIVYTRFTAGAKPKGLISLPVEHTLLVLSGKLNVQLGTDQFTAGPETMVLVPADVPHQAWNAGSEQAVVFEVITPAPTREISAIIKPAQARKIENAAQYIRVAPPLGKLAGGVGHDSLNERILADKGTGSAAVLERLNDVLPGGGRTEPHLHPFDQAYFIRSGSMTVDYAAEKYEAPANSLVLLPMGVVHNNSNTGTVPQSIVTLLIPDKQPRGAGYTVKKGGGGEQ